MSYILETILVNKKENLFFTGSLAREGKTDLVKEFQVWYNNFLQSYVDKGYFVDDKYEITDDNIQNEHGHWLYIKRIGFFKERAMAIDFLQTLSAHDVIYRQMARAWGKANSIAGESNVLDSNEAIDFQTSNCQTGYCFRKNGSLSCPTGPDACHDPTTGGFDPKDSPVKEYHVSLDSFIKFKKKIVTSTKEIT